MRQKKLTLIMPIRAGAEADLKALLVGFGNDVRNNTVLRFPDSPSTHFIRLVVLDRQAPARLLFSACYSGTLDEYAAELVQKSGPGLDQIFSYCDGYRSADWLSASAAAALCRSRDHGFNVFV